MGKNKIMGLMVYFACVVYNEINIKGNCKHQFDFNL